MAERAGAKRGRSIFGHAFSMAITLTKCWSKRSLETRFQICSMRIRRFKSMGILEERQGLRKCYCRVMRQKLEIRRTKLETNPKFELSNYFLRCQKHGLLGR